MDKKKLKKEIVNTCINSLEESVETTRKRIAEIIQTANDYEGDHDIFDPFKEDMMKKKDLQVKQMEKHLEEIKLIKRVDPERILEKVEFGSVVITDKQNMFVSVALGKVSVKGDTYHVISTQVPAYQAMKDLKVGESFSINNNSFKIESIY